MDFTNVEQAFAEYANYAERTKAKPEGFNFTIQQLADFEYIMAELEAPMAQLDALKKQIVYKPLPDGKEQIEPGFSLDVLHAIIGIATESYELLECLQKALATGQLDEVNLFEEVADHCWYVSILTRLYPGQYGKSLSANISKLQKRFPDKFAYLNAYVRDLSAERAILEKGLS